MSQHRALRLVAECPLCGTWNELPHIHVIGRTIDGKPTLTAVRRAAVSPQETE